MAIIRRKKSIIDWILLYDIYNIIIDTNKRLNKKIDE